MRAERVSPPSRGGEDLWGNVRGHGSWRHEGGEAFRAGAPPHSDRNEAVYCRCTANHDPGRPGQRRGHPGRDWLLVAQLGALGQTQQVVRPHPLHSSANRSRTCKLALRCWWASGEASRPDKSIEPSWRAEEIASASALRTVSTSSPSGSSASTPSMRWCSAPSRAKEVMS